MMNLNALEKLTRQAIKGSNTSMNSRMMLNNGFITPAEHRSISSLSWQIAANVRANGNGAAAGTWATSDTGTDRFWG
ncbi:MAG: hypothetical protein ABIO92_09125 [Chloroflexia bacterium]